MQVRPNESEGEHQSLEQAMEWRRYFKQKKKKRKKCISSYGEQGTKERMEGKVLSPNKNSINRH